MTNADKIRAMTTEELVELFCSIYMDEEDLLMTIGNSCGLLEAYDIREWLESEVDEDE